MVRTRKLLHSPASVAIAASIFTTLVLTGVMSWAAVPAPSGVISSCYRNTDGQLRVRNASQSCPTGFTPLQWIQAGKQLDSVRVYSSTQQTIQAGTYTPLSFDQERWDTSRLHKTTNNNSRLTAARDGLYQIEGGAVWAPGSGTRWVFFILNGGPIIASQQVFSGGGGFDGSVSTTYRLDVGDYVELGVYTDSGGTVVTAGNYSPEFAMTRLGP
jgi:hypothetical protein